MSQPPQPPPDPQRHAEQELARVNAFLDAVVENIPDMIFVKRADDHMFIRFNRAGEELLGWKRSELLGKTDHDFYPKEQADFFHAKDRETLRNKVLVDVPEEPIDTKAKGRRWLHTRKVPVLDERGEPLYLLGISEDITDRKASEERARALERELATLAQNAREAIVAWTPEGRIVSWNAAAETIYGFTAQKALGRNVESLVPDYLKAQFLDAQNRLLAGEPMPPETYHLRPQNRPELEIEESRFIIPGPDGRPARIASFGRDVTELSRLKLANEILGANTAPRGAAAIRGKRMQETLASSDIVASDANATVLLLGETGVGKGWLARRVHERSPRAQKPFFEVNCAGLSGQLVESELFGHERGAFTGAMQQKRGIVEAAEGGTLFLDEIGELPLGVQAQLLTFLDHRSYRRVGGTRALTANVRLLAATNLDLKAAVERGVFRRDLFYRLSVVPIVVPPLRERREEIAELTESMLEELARRAGRARIHASTEVIAALERYAWPGNVRELRNALERALILSRGEAITRGHLPPEIRGDQETSSPLSNRLEDVERTHILRVLESEGGNRTRAALMLGVSRSTLKRKLAELSVKQAG